MRSKNRSFNSSELAVKWLGSGKTTRGRFEQESMARSERTARKDFPTSQASSSEAKSSSLNARHQRESSQRIKSDSFTTLETMARTSASAGALKTRKSLSANTERSSRTNGIGEWKEFAIERTSTSSKRKRAWSAGDDLVIRPTLEAEAQAAAMRKRTLSHFAEPTTPSNTPSGSRLS